MHPLASLRNPNVISDTSIKSLATPCLLLDTERMQQNASKLLSRLNRFPVRLRPHFKTPKCMEVFKVMLGAQTGPATVSTLKEAEYLLAHGVTDILYAVGIAPNKLGHVFDLRRRGARLSIILDNAEVAGAVAESAKANADAVPVLLEIDSDGHRSGLAPDDPELIRVGRIIAESKAELAGIITHAGSSYDTRDEISLMKVAGQERAAAVSAADALRGAGLPCPVVSVGSTPTAHFAQDLTGVTEVRAGVYIFFDLVMAGIGVCREKDIALSVLTTVIGHQKSRGWTIVDAGWMAMSRDRGTANQPVDQFYGVVCDIDGNPYPDFVMLQANQEHGILAIRPGSDRAPPELAPGTMVRILPNHACATAAQHDCYRVINRDGSVQAVWPRINGW
jgi:D-serine deaminase-like pyridoxal phosphate-dependent protein